MAHEVKCPHKDVKMTYETVFSYSKGFEFQWGMGAGFH